MRIEVATPTTESTKAKGDLLEKLSAKVLDNQNFEVETQVRLTGVELDLLCKHRITSKRVYVECKAHRDPLSANVITQILGTIQFHDCQEGWLITTGELGKEAKGLVDKWEQKTGEDRSRLSIYTPQRLIDLLIRTHQVCRRPENAAADFAKSSEALGDWILLLTPWGVFWTIPLLQDGVPTYVLVFSGANGAQVTDTTTLRNIRTTDTSLSTLDFESPLNESVRSEIGTGTGTALPKVVPVEAGHDWADYRPARPDYFVGRKEAQDRVLRFLGDVRRQSTPTRVFAITGDSGMGKSSLIAKLRERCRNNRYRNSFFIYAVDMRAAVGPSYVSAALLAAIEDAISVGFAPPCDGLRITDHADPLSSPSISTFLAALECEHKVLCLVFDQFEELYSKSELFPIFEEAQRLFLSAISACTSLVLGFAWKTDSTVQQGHPAYFMWHRLGDHRLETELQPFSHAEATSALTLFEKAVETKLRPELRRQIIEISQGFPWLIKKLCVHLIDQMRLGKTQEEFSDTFDVAKLFDRDLQSLTAPELSCLRSIASTAPADWFEVLEHFGGEVLRSLQNRRLIIRSGDRVNVYWDIFREYVLSKEVPSLPFTYLPSSPSLKALLFITRRLSHEVDSTVAELAHGTALRASTVHNIVHDLLMFGVAAGGPTTVRLDPRLDSSDPIHVLQRVREVMKRHAVRSFLSAFDHGQVIGRADLIAALKAGNRAAQHGSRTWTIYAERVAKWMQASGFLVSVPDGWRYTDRGSVTIPTNRGRRVTCFRADAPPRGVIEAAEILQGEGMLTPEAIRERGIRNAVSVLLALGLATRAKGGSCELVERARGRDALTETWQAARNNTQLQAVLQFVDENPSACAEDIAACLQTSSSQLWSQSTKTRIGNGLLQWVRWLIRCRATGKAVLPRVGRKRRCDDRKDDGYPTLFD